MRMQKEGKPRIALLIPKFMEGFKQESIPLNLSYLGAALEKAGYFVRGFNLDMEEFPDDLIKKFNVFGITFPTSVFPKAVELIKKIKKVNPSAKVIVGGSHPTALPEECLQVKEIDFVIVSDGEISLLKLMEHFEGKLVLKKVPNLVYRSGKKIIHNRIETIKDLDQIPFPAKHIFDVSLYPDKQKAYGDIIASRGCPFCCTNCKPALDKISPYRIRKPEKVVEEMKWLKEKYGVKHFTFSDSELVGPKFWVKKFTQEIIRRKLRVTYSCNGRTDQTDKEILKFLKKSGCVFIGFGIESGSQEVIDKILRKGINLKRSKEVIAETEKIGIGTGAWFMVGIPGENEEQVKQTIDFSQQLSSSIIEVNIATPWPSTGFYNLAKKKEWLVTEDWTKMNEKNFVSMETDFLTTERTKQLFSEFKNGLLSKGWKPDSTQTRFYHPYFLWKTLRTGLRTVLYRGVGKSDFVKLVKWVGGNY